jgi:signal transduction histidine kinase
MNRLNRATWLLFFLLQTSLLYAQAPADSNWVDISSVRLSRDIRDQAPAVFLPPGGSLRDLYTPQLFQTAVQPGHFIRPKYVTHTLVLRFHLFNSSDSAAGVWFFPGLSYWEINLYRLDNDLLVKVPRKLPRCRDSIGYRYLSLPAHDSAIFFAEMVPVKTHLNSIRPRLITNEFLPSFISEKNSTKDEGNIVTYLFCGLMLMMILYSLASYWQGANREFLYYALYAFFIGCMLFTKGAYAYRTDLMGYFLEEYLDFILQCTGILFFMIFMRKYLDTKQRHPFLDKLYKAGIIILIVSMVFYTYLNYFSDNFTLENQVENYTKVLLLVLVIVFLVYSIRHWQDKLLRFLFWGNLCLLVFSLFSLVLLISRPVVTLIGGLLGSALFHYEIGLFLELVFFLVALNHKNRIRIAVQARERERLKAENMLKEYEKEIAVYKAQQDERQRISADMHDELGSGMTAIRLMSEIARNKMKENTPVEIDRISHSADEVLNKMNAIIWSMNSGNDTLDNLISYIRSYALEYFDNTSVDCKVTTPQDIPDIEISGDKRRNIFLCVKESLNNILKHARASQVTIRVSIDNELLIEIRDNGVGIDLENIREFGNGLKNINRRMENIGGHYSIRNEGGTVTKLRLPISLNDLPLQPAATSPQ